MSRLLGFFSSALRTFYISLVLVWGFLSYGVRRLFAGRLSVEARDRLRGQVMAKTCERLGATFIKFGQILSTRPDLLGPGYIEPLSQLQDQVQPESPARIQKVLSRELGSKREQLEIDFHPIAAASVAQVHRATVKATGQKLALKVQRPGVDSRILGDIGILEFWAKVINAIPSMRPLSLPGAVKEFGDSLKGQLDFCQEARNNARFRENFASIEGLAVPAIFPDYSSKHVLAMEFVEGVKASEPEKVGGDRARLARIGAAAILKMVFSDGFVHADLHPGNIILTPDGKVVIIDLGMVAEIPPEMMRPWISTFLALGQQNGAEVARLLYVHAPDVGDIDYYEYEAECVAWFARWAGKPLGEIETSVVISGVMNILRRYRVRIDPSFTVVQIALMVAEGLGKQLDPSLDIVKLALPVLAQAMMRNQGGLEPRRTIPPRVVSEA